MKNKILSIFVMFILVFSNIVSALDESTDSADTSGVALSSEQEQPAKGYLEAPKSGNKITKEEQVGADLFSGALAYNYQIEVPSGINGLEPSISISYNSHSGLSIGDAGAGWNLNTASIYRDINYTLNDNSDDFFRISFNGINAKLIYDTKEDRYHTEIESYLFIKKEGDYWTVKTNDGKLYRLGYNKDSKLEQGSITSIWNLDLVEDTYGNKIEYNYLKNPNGDVGVLYLDNVRYGVNEIKFIYNYKLINPSILYSQGNEIKKTGLIDEISVKNNNNIIRKYIFKYSSLNSLSKFFLIELKETDKDGNALPSIKFEYDYGEGWSKTSKWETWVGFGDYTRLAELNGDGLTDIMKSVPSCTTQNCHNILLNTGNGWNEEKSQILYPNGFGYYTRLADINGDGLTDIITKSPEGEADILLNTGDGWKWASGYLKDKNDSSKWDKLSISLGEYTYVVDLNGDSLADIIHKNPYDEAEILLNTGNGWKEDSSWKTDIKLDKYTSISDVNGDGLVDVISKSPYSSSKVLLNTGGGWRSVNWDIPIDLGDYTTLVDLNGDGLADIIHKDLYNEANIALNTGSGWKIIKNSGLSMSVPLSQYTQLTDVNGDGLADIIRSVPSCTTQNCNQVFINSAKPMLLKKIRNELGGETRINYKTSTSFDNTGSDDKSDLPFNVWVVDSIKRDNKIDGAQNIISNISYNYANGLYDYEDKEFRGFNYVEESLSDKKIVHYFYQDDAKKGMEYKNEIFDKNSNPYKKTEREFSSVKKDNYYITNLDSAKEYSYDGSTNPKTTKTGFNYDGYGNVIKTTYYGDADLNWDERYENNEYLYNTDKWIIKLKHSYLSDANSKKVTETFFSYDKQPYNANPLKGSLTQTEYWLEGNNPKNYYDYDEFGNVILKTDSNGNAIKYEYDNTHTFIIRETNALGQASSFVYDPGTGNLLSKTDANGYKTEYKYDNFGRIIKEIQPYDSEEYPNVKYEYETDGNAPEKTITKYRIESGKSDSYDEYYFYDGLGNLIQSKKESDNKQIVSNVFYDENGRLKIAANPFFSDYSQDYTINSNVKGIVYSYDPMDRVLKVKDQKGNENKFEYDKRELTITDKNGHKKKYYYDAYDNIIEVREYNGNENYETNYFYNSLNQIIKIEDAQGNKIEYDYDSLGRKTRLKDPDMGILEYGYDKNGNLIKENNNGIIINFEYDKLNRLIKESSPDKIIYYEYDSGTIGKLSKVKSSGFEISYVYDKRYRLIEERKIIDGILFSTKWDYDSMDRVTKIILPDGKITTYSYNDGKLKKISEVLNNIGYNEQGQITKRDYLNGLVSEFDYDQDNFRLKRINTGNYQDLRYKYDNAGNMIEISNSVDNTKESMEYDEIDRLTKAERIKNNAEKIFSISYYYDSIGNIIEIASEKYKLLFEFGKTIAHAPIKVISVGENKDNNEDNNGDNRERKDILTEPVNETKENKIILHRTIRDCSTKKPVSGEQIIEIVTLSNGRMSYNNYKCNSRYEEQCIIDGSFDSYYDEWCEYN